MKWLDCYYTLRIQACTQSIDAMMRTYVYGNSCPIAQPSQESEFNFAAKQAFEIPRIDGLLRKRRKRLVAWYFFREPNSATLAIGVGRREPLASRTAGYSGCPPTLT